MMPKPNALPWLLLSVAGHRARPVEQELGARPRCPSTPPVPVIDGFWNWYRTYNTGAAFSFLSDAGGWQKYFFIVLAFGISGLLALLAGAHAARATGARRCPSRW